jgi:hypothetical protein
MTLGKYTSPKIKCSGPMLYQLMHQFEAFEDILKENFEIDTSFFSLDDENVLPATS